jgi:pimeloyl-ACP methyl ester carboxylesterase
MAVERTIEIPGLELSCRWWGEASPTGVPMLALHGWLDNAATFDALAPRLGDRTLVALDLPGHGRSDHLGPGASYLFIDYVATVHAVLDALGWTRCDLMGHSLGASVVAVAAATDPARVRKLALLEGLGPYVESEAGTPGRLVRALAAERRTAARAEHSRPVYPDLDAVVRRLQAAGPSMLPASARTLLTRGLREVDGGVTWRSDRRLRHPSRVRLTEGQVLAFLAAIECPTLLVRASGGLPVAAEVTRRRVDAVRDLTVVHVDGGHHVHLDAPELVAPSLCAFLDEAPSP